jgi:predicted GIY-YIG superfamily endonuclease
LKTDYLDIILDLAYLLNLEKPWKIVYQIQFPTRSEAVILEQKIKKRGAKRYLEDIGFFK